MTVVLTQTAEEVEASAEAEAKAKAEAEAKLLEFRARMESRHKETTNGEIVVRLLRTIEVVDQTRADVVVRPVKSGDLRSIGETNDVLDALMDRLVSPPGAADEFLAGADYDAVMHAVDRQLGKYRGRRYGSAPSEP